MIINEEGNLVEQHEQVTLNDFSLGFYADLYMNCKCSDELFIYVLIKNNAIQSQAQGMNMLDSVKNILQLTLKS